MVKVSCKVIQDLCPLYVDDVCSNESRKLIEEHIEECESCKEILKATKQDLTREKQFIKGNGTDRNLNGVKKKWVGSTILVMIFAFMLFVFIYKEPIFQEGNPLYSLKPCVKLAISKDYVDISDTRASYAGTIQFITKRNDKEAFFHYIEERYQLKFDQQMGDGYRFVSETSSLLIESRSYMKFYTIWEVGEVNNIV